MLVLRVCLCVVGWRGWRGQEGEVRDSEAKCHVYPDTAWLLLFLCKSKATTAADQRY